MATYLTPGWPTAIMPAIFFFHRVCMIRCTLPGGLKVVWAPQGSSASEVSRKSQAIFEKAAELDLHLAVTQVSQGLVWPELHWDQPRVACLRSCLMKPEHLEWLPEICRRLEESL